MAVTIQGGHGVRVKIGATAIARILDAEFPNQVKKLVEVMAHDSPSGYMEYADTGMREMESFELDIAWDYDDTSHAAIVTAFDSTTPTAMTIYDPSGIDEKIAFDAHVEQIGRIAEQDGLYHCKVKVQPSGKPTITTTLTATEA